jgi:hypothetical protein
LVFPRPGVDYVAPGKKSHFFHTNRMSGRDRGSNPGHLRGRQQRKPLTHSLRRDRHDLQVKNFHGRVGNSTLPGALQTPLAGSFIDGRQTWFLTSGIGSSALVSWHMNVSKKLCFLLFCTYFE